MGAGGTPNTKISTELMRAKHFYDSPSLESIKQIMGWFVYDAKSLEKEIEEIAIPRFEMAMRPEVKRSNSSIFAGKALAVPETALRRLEHELIGTWVG